MIILERKVPLRMQILEAKIRRLLMNDQELAMNTEKLRQMKAGYAGELRVDREWKELRYPCYYYLLHDLQLINDLGSTHQIDTLFICQHFALVVEVKNIKGRIDFDEITHQCIRTHPNGEIEGLSTGINQVKRHEEFLLILLSKLGVSIPIKSFIIFPYPSSILGKTSTSVRIFNVSGLRDEIHTLFKQYPNSILSEKDLGEVAKTLKKLHQPRPITYKVEPNKMQRGVLCTHCSYTKVMFYKNSKWHCYECGGTSNLSFYEALHDYRLLESEVLTNQILRGWFGIPTRQIANKLLKKLNFPFSGMYRNTKYIIPPDIFERGQAMHSEHI